MNAHKHTYTRGHAPTWHDAQPPDIAQHRNTGRLRGCSWCGSMHPTDLAAALLAGASVHWADWKYGWPHKVYVEDVPNPHAGMLECRSSGSHAVPDCPKTGEPCAHGKQSAYYRSSGCECMRAEPGTPAFPTTGRSDFNGQAMRLVADGRFDSATGKPTYGWDGPLHPAGATTGGKFYTEHLQDAAPEERAVIERAMGLSFTFTDDGTVSWKPAPSAEAPTTTAAVAPGSGNSGAEG